MTNPSDPKLLTQVKQYRFVRELGRGGMGTVYEAIDSRDGGRVAVKLLHPWLAAEDTSFRDRFEREAHIAALLRSPYSVRLLDFGVADGTYFLVMEFVEGTTVGKELEKGPMEPVRALRIAIDVARALEEAAARGVVHRDIKPDNILLTEDGRVKVTDFGIARQEGGTGLTSAGRFVGTAEYAAPEQAVGEADHRSDIYSLGATLYCMLAGHPPFQGASVWDLLREHQTSAVSMEPLSHLPDSIDNPIRRCLEKDPRDRYQSASELAGALERALASLLHSTQAPKTTPPPAGTTTPRPPEAPRQPDVAATQVAGPAAAATQVGGPGAGATQVAGPGAPTVVGGVAAAAPAQPAGPAQFAMSATPTGARIAGVTNYELTISNPLPETVRLNLVVNDPSGSLQVTVPTPVTLTGREISRLPMQVRQRTAPRGAGALEFQVAANREDGERAGFVNVMVQSATAGKGGGGGGKKKGPPMWLFALAGLAAAGAIGFGVIALQGDDEPTEPTPTPAATGTVPATGEATQSVTAAPTTQVPETQVPASATATEAPTVGINVIERWDYAFEITGNTCTFGASVGDRYNVSFRFDPATGSDTFIADGDRVRVTAVVDRDIEIGVFTFRMQDFEFTYPVVASGGERGIATLVTTFSGPETIGASSLTESYKDADCVITGAPFGQ